MSPHYFLTSIQRHCLSDPWARRPLWKDGLGGFFVHYYVITDSQQSRFITRLSVIILYHTVLVLTDLLVLKRHGTGKYNDSLPVACTDTLILDDQDTESVLF